MTQLAVVTIMVPFAVRMRSGRKLVLAPDGAPAPPLAPQVDSTLVKVIVRAFRWQKLLETGQYATIKEIAKAERINPSYISRGSPTPSLATQEGKPRPPELLWAEYSIDSPCRQQCPSIVNPPGIS